MALDNGNKYALGEFLAVGIQRFIRENAADVIRLWDQIGETEQTLTMLKRAIDLPHRIRTRFNLWLDEYDAKNSPGAAALLMGDCLDFFNEGKTTTTSVSDVNTRLTAMENFATNLVSQSPTPYGDGTFTWNGVVDELRQHAWEPSITSRLPPTPNGYTDVWGE